MKIPIAIIAFLLFLGCQNNQEQTKAEQIKPENPNNTHSFYVGTYTGEESQGIYKYLLQEDGNLKRIGLAATTESPSFLALSPDQQYLLAVNEISQEDKGGAGTVESYLIKGDSLSFISRRSSGGAHPCFVTMNERGAVLTANYTGGNIGLLNLDKKGALSDLLDVQQHTGKGTTDRQDGPHAHSAWFEADGKNIISVDLGTNELWFSQLDADQKKFIPADPPTLKMAPGGGPRHLVRHPNRKWVYVLNELSNTVALLLKTGAGTYERGASISTLPIDYTEFSKGADIHISSDGNFLYSSNRGHNSIAIFEVNTTSGALKLLAHESTRGDGPRNFSLSPDERHLLVANQHSNNIVSFRRDEGTGQLEYISQVEAPTPVCILFSGS